VAILSDIALAVRLASDLVVRPTSPTMLQPASLDLRLGPKLLVATPDGFVPHHLIDDGPFRLDHDRFVLGATLEFVAIPLDLAGMLMGKSSRAREGIQIESAGYVDPGWRGELTLEIKMMSPIPTRLVIGMPIAQLRLEELVSPALNGYGSRRVQSHYQNSSGPVPSRATVLVPTRNGSTL